MIASATSSVEATAKQSQAPKPVEYVVALPPGLTLLNANDRLHYHARARIVRDIRAAAKLIAKNNRIPPLTIVRIIGVLHPTRRGHRDSHNWFPTLKAAVDGIVSAGVLPDDDDSHVVGTEVVLGEPVPRGQFVVRIQVAAPAAEVPAPALNAQVAPPRRTTRPTGAA